MKKRNFLPVLLLLPAVLLILESCRDEDKPPPRVEIVQTPEQLAGIARDHIRNALRYASAHEGDIGDSTRLFAVDSVQYIYEQNDYLLSWSDSLQWKPLADSLLHFIRECKLYGLYPVDYHATELENIFSQVGSDSLAARNAVNWARADMMLTDAFVHLVHDLKLGKLRPDSVSLRTDTVLTNEDYLQQWNILHKAGSVQRVFRHLEPRHEGYHLLKAGLRDFLEKADFGDATLVPAYRDDSLNFRRRLQRRLFETGFIGFDSIPADSLQLSLAVKKFQKVKGITEDGKAGTETLGWLNQTDRDRFALIALTMDKFKLLPVRMPERYIWVNIPSYSMRLQSGDSILLWSRIICGKPLTPTPQLNSAISEIITYPQWTVPASIIRKEMLPAIKKDPGYLASKGFSLVDKDGEVVDPYSVDWSIYKKGIPYKVVQGSGDENALGVLKFNFPNKYAVYLHDTNQRSLFGRSRRSLSHGCVRVQEWQELAHLLLRDPNPEKSQASEDSMITWLERKEKHSIPVRQRLPLFIRYHTAEAGEKGILFYEDIYGEDRRLIDQYYNSGKRRGF